MYAASSVAGSGHMQRVPTPDESYNLRRFTAEMIEARHSLRHVVWQFLTLNVDLDQRMGLVLRRCAITYMAVNSVCVIMLFVVDQSTRPTDTTAGVYQLQLVLLCVWTVEYVLRIWSCVENIGEDVAEHTQKRRCCERLGLVIQPLMVLDFLSIAALLVDSMLDENSFRGISSLRLLSLVRIERDCEIMGPVLGVVKKKKQELLASMALVVILLVVVSVCMYYLEVEDNPENFGSVPATMWWACITMSTVGYGDAYPDTDLGKVLASATCLLGAAMFALPAGIIASGFQEERDEESAADTPLLDPGIEEILARKVDGPIFHHRSHGAAPRQAAERRLDAAAAEVAALRGELRQLAAALGGRGRGAEACGEAAGGEARAAPARSRTG
ncbi:unnamed protein product [Prorocentrum cordatum]|uniref:Ion transport domain-containing protein n=1 Tax=Prorocentrum cordatum TaxID=2364126 RepID=A0ABN9XTV3_9DINO|nr:unnamed protein product [Polarella glacialis]